MAQEILIPQAQGEIQNFVPEATKAIVAKLDALAAYAVKAKDPELIEKTAEAKVAEISQLVAWWDACVQAGGGDRQSAKALLENSNSGLSVRKLVEICGIPDWQVSTWRTALAKGTYKEVLIKAWEKKAGLLPDEGGAGGGGGGSARDFKTSLGKLLDGATGEELDYAAEEIQRRRKNTGRIATKLEKKDKALPKPDYVEDDFTGIVEKPADYRVTKAVHAFFNDVPGNKRVWLQQRMEEQPSPMKGDGVHVQWIKAFWDSDPEVQSAIREGIKLENTKRMEG